MTPHEKFIAKRRRILRRFRQRHAARWDIYPSAEAVRTVESIQLKCPSLSRSQLIIMLLEAGARSISGGPNANPILQQPGNAEKVDDA